MQADPIFTSAKMMATSSPDRIKESFLECIGMLSGSTVSFVMKVDGSEGRSFERPSRALSPSGSQWKAFLRTSVRP